MKSAFSLALIVTIYWLPTIIGWKRRVMWMKRVIFMNAIGFLVLPWIFALWDAISPFASTEKDPWPEHSDEARRRIARREGRAA